MQMMYDVVARELKSMQRTDLHPQDYLNFYCLGNREEHPQESLSSNDASVSNCFTFSNSSLNPAPLTETTKWFY